MAFNTGLSGLRAASVDLDVTGNNIANASTVGFKGSEVQFGDLYASGFLSGATNAIGDGVKVQSVNQTFGQGNISFTDNGLDMAIDGDGFFILNNDGEVRYSRAGQFTINKDGFVVNNQGMRVQGFQADNDGNLSGVRGDLMIDSDNLAPRRTTSVDSQLNLDSRESVLATSGTRLQTRDFAPNESVGDQSFTLTYPDGSTSTVQIPSGSSAREIANALSQEDGVSASGRTELLIDGSGNAAGDVFRLENVDFEIPAGATDGERLQKLADDINSSSLSSINATITDGGQLRLISSRGDTLRIRYGDDPDTGTGTSSGAGTMSLFVDKDEDGVNDLMGASKNISTDQNAPTTQAGTVSVTLDRDVQLAAADTVEFDLNGANIQTGDTFTIDGTALTISGASTSAQRVQDLVGAINSSGLGVTATVVGSTGLQLSSDTGGQISLSYQDNGGGGSMSFSGGVVVSEDSANPNVVDGSVLDGVTPTAFTSNTFDPTDQGTYNHATSSTIYDSLGNPHVMTQYFVKEPNTSASQGNAWTMYVQVDGENVGDPPNSSGEPTMAQYDLVFDEEGNLQSIDGDPDGEVLISNWTPVDGNGQPNGADGPRLVSSGGTTPIPDPPVSSNFVIDLGDTTQFGSEFAVNDQSQNGYTTGRLSGLDVSDAGVIFARYSNGQSQSLGQVSLATFKNAEGLSPVGDTTWVETFESGQPIIGSPGSGTLGSIAASSVEESNVDLSEELVNLIIAQRNYQANAKTIETSDAVTQTIINLR